MIETKNSLEQTRTPLPFGLVSLMNLFSIKNHHETLWAFDGLLEEVSFRRLERGDKQAEEATVELVERVLGQLISDCENLNLDGTVALSSMAIAECKRGRTTLGELRTRLLDIHILFQTECFSQKFLRLTKEESDAFDNAELFGAAVASSFSSEQTRCEIVEVGSCYAVGRYTACVFHLMRVLERGLLVLASDLKVPFAVPAEYSNWQNIIEQIEAQIKSFEKLKAGPHKTETLKAYSEAAKQFRYFKDAWRNHVAHSREVYDKGQAMSIMLHVKEFMQHLASLGLSD